MTKLLVCSFLIVILIGYIIFKLSEQTIYYKPVINVKSIIMIFLLGLASSISIILILFFIICEKIKNDDLWDEIKDDNMIAHSKNINNVDLSEYSYLVKKPNKRLSKNEQKVNDLLKDIDDLTVNNTDNEVKSLVNNSHKLKLYFYETTNKNVHNEILRQLETIKKLILVRTNTDNELVNKLKANERYLNFFKDGDL